MVIDEAGGAAKGRQRHNSPGGNGIYRLEAVRIHNLPVLEEKARVPGQLIREMLSQNPV